MTSSTRFSLRLCAWTLFLVGGPLLLAYARGYRIPWSALQEGESLTRPVVGALVVRSTPMASTVRIDGVIVDTSTPTSIGSLPRGEYLVRVEKTGYRPYEARLRITPGRVTDLLHTLLLPEHLAGETSVGVRDLWVSPDERWALIREETRSRIVPLDALVTNAGFTRDALAGITIAPALPPGNPLRVQWSAEYVALSFGGRRGTVVIDIRSGRRLTVPARYTVVSWDSEDQGVLVLLSREGTLVSFRVATRAERVLARGVVAAAGHPRGVLVQREARQASVTPLELIDRAGSVRVVADPLPAPAVRLHVSGSLSIAAVAGTEATLYVRRAGDASWTRLAPDVTAEQWSPDSDKLLFQRSEFELFAVNITEKRSVLPPLVPELLIRLTTPLRSVTWYPDSQRAVLFAYDTLTFVSVDPRDGHRREELVSVNRGDATYRVRRDGRSLLVTAREDGRDNLLFVPLRVP